MLPAAGEVDHGVLSGASAGVAGEPPLGEVVHLGLMVYR